MEILDARDALDRGTQLMLQGRLQEVSASCQQFVEVVAGEAIRLSPQLETLTFYPLALFAARLCEEADRESHDDRVLQRAASFLQCLHRRRNESIDDAAIRSLLELFAEGNYSGGSRGEGDIRALTKALLMFVGGAREEGIVHAWGHLPAFLYTNPESTAAIH